MERFKRKYGRNKRLAMFFIIRRAYESLLSARLHGKQVSIMAEEKLRSAGRQIEGVMMRNKSKVAIAIRQGEGNIMSEKEYRSPSERYPF